MATFKTECSLTEKNGAYEMNFNYKNDKGIDIKEDIAGNDPITMAKELRDNVVAKMLKQQKQLEQAKQEKEKKSDKKVEEKEDGRVAALKAKIKELTEENNSLKTDLQILQQRADDAVNQLMVQKEAEEAEEDLHLRRLRAHDGRADREGRRRGSC